MIKDPNGSIQVSYVDMRGPTVATAMAGTAPSSLSPLKSNLEQGVSMTVNVKEDMPLLNGATSTTSDFPFLASSKGNYAFNYLINVENARIGDLCLNCGYELDFDIKDDCGKSISYKNIEHVLPEGSEINVTENFPLKMKFKGSDLVCSGNEPIKIIVSFNVDFQKVGTYTVTRRFKLDPTVYNEAIEKFMNSSEVIPLKKFVDDEITKTDFSGCNADDCPSNCLKEYPDDYEAYMNCVSSCDLQDSCKNVKNRLCGDFHPGEIINSQDKLYFEGDEIVSTPVEQSMGGQYATYTLDAKGKYEFSKDENSLLSEKKFNELIVNDPYFKDYQDLTLFIDNFNDTWAEYLAERYHPEWARSITKCQNVEEKKEYEVYLNKLMNVNTYKEAYSLGLLEPLDLKELKGTFNSVMPNGAIYKANLDPFFKNDENVAQQMRYKMTNIPVFNTTTSIWRMAIFMAGQEDGMTLAESESLLSKNFPSTVNVNSYCDYDWDKVWLFFKTLYMSYRNQYMQSKDESVYPPLNEKYFTVKTKRIPTSDDYYTEEEKGLLNVTTMDDDRLKTYLENHSNVNGDVCRSQAMAQISSVMAYLPCDTCKPCKKQLKETMVYGTDISVYDSIQNAFIDIMAFSCEKSGNFLGYRDIPSEYIGTTGAPQYESFESAMETIMRDANLEMSVYCSPYLINSPGTYGIDNEFTTQKPLDKCGCETMMQYDQEFSQKVSPSFDIPNSKVYFEKETGLSVYNFNRLLCTCRSNYNFSQNVWNNDADVALKASGLEMPADLECDVCFSCREIENRLKEWTDVKNDFLDENLYTKMFSGFLDNWWKYTISEILNKEFNMHKSYAEYENFVKQCAGIPDGTATVTICQPTAKAKDFVEIMDDYVRFHSFEKKEVIDQRINDKICELFDTCTCWTWVTDTITKDLVEMLLMTVR